MKTGFLNIVPESSPRIMRTLYWSLALIGIFFFQQMDLCQTAPQSVMFLEAVRQGEWRHFYTFASGDYQPAYHIIFYVVFGLWNLPLYLLGAFFPGLLELHTVVLWSKLLPALCFLSAGNLIAFVAQDAGDSEPERTKYDFLWSPVAFYFIFFFGGYDIFAVILLLWALRFYLRKELWRFTLVIAFAACFKYFALIAFLPLLLFAEKRPLRLLGHIALAVLPAILTTLPFLGDPALVSRGAFEQGFLLRLLSQKLPFVPGGVPLFPLTYCILLYFCYTRRPRNEFQRCAYPFYLVLLSYTLLFAFGAMHTQWLILLVPFWSLCLLPLDHERRKRGVLLQGLFFLALCGIFAIANTNGLDQRMIQDSFAGQWIGTNSSLHALEMRDLFGVGEPFVYGYWTVYAAALLLLAYELRPGDGQIGNPRPFPIFCRCLLLRFTALAFFIIPAVFSFGFSKHCETQIYRKYRNVQGFLAWSLGDEDSGGNRPASLKMFAHANSPVLYRIRPAGRRQRAEELANGKSVVVELPKLSAPAAGFDLMIALPRGGLIAGETRMRFLNGKGDPIYFVKILHSRLDKNRYYRVVFPPSGLIPDKVILQGIAPAGYAPFLQRFGNGEVDCRLVLSRQ